MRFNLLDRPRGNVKLDVLDRCVEHIVELGWSVDLHIDMKNLLDQEDRIRHLPLPVVIDHIARVKPAEGLNQRGFQLLLDLIKLKHVWVKVSGADKICNTRVRDYFWPALCRGDSLCPGRYRGGAGSDHLGHRLAPLE